MSLVWPASEAQVQLGQPQLHAFIVGVGSYTHLGGGPGPLAADPLGLSQLTTPLHTAPAIANWLLTSYKNADCPLGSVEMLLSPSGQQTLPGGTTIEPEAATMVNLKQAFARWVTRCGTQADNVAFFYFCGHGLSKGAQFLLPEDFANPQVPNRWENCVDFDGMRVGMRSIAAQKQLFFVDACRETPFGLLTQLNVRGDALIDAGVFDSVKCSAAYYATAEGKQAFGKSDDVSYFGKAVLSCLNGVASLMKKDKWVVDSFQLGSALGQVMEQYAKRYRLPLTCNPNVTGMALIHEVAGPKVLVSVECTSAEANAVAEVFMVKGTTTLESAIGEPKPLLDEVEPGDWSVGVRFPGGQFDAAPARTYTLMPPLFEGVSEP